MLLGKLGGPITVDTLNRMLRPLKKLFPSKNLNAKTIRQSVIVNWINEERIPIEEVQLLSGINGCLQFKGIRKKTKRIRWR